jgi:LPXTG-motif cell wall-anchored protein
VPTLTHESTCDKLIVRVSNPADGRTVEATIKVGDQTDSETIEPGETAVAEIDEPEDGLVAIVTVGDKVTEVKYEKPDNCGGLPVTGVNASVTAGVALVLVTGGIGLFLAFRRRRIRFAA